MNHNTPTYIQGFSLLELLIVVVIAVLGSTWAVPQYRRKLSLSQLDQYTQQVESGLFHLRARQSAEGTSCEINFNPNFAGLDTVSNGFGTPEDVIELSHLSTQQRHQRLQCCDASQCSWDPPYRLIDNESTHISRAVELKVSESKYSLSPPGTSTDESPLVVLIRSINWNQDSRRPLPIRCVKFSTAGHIHQGVWEKKRCRRR